MAKGHTQDYVFHQRDRDDAARAMASQVHVVGDHVFGTNRPISIMNHGGESELTDDDKADLTTLYLRAWDGDLTHINGTPIRIVRPFSSLAPVPDGVFALGRQPVG